MQAVHNVVDRAFTALATAIPPASPTPTMYTSLIHQSAFHIVGNDCYTRAISTPPPTSAETLQLDLRLESWYSSLPEHIKDSSASESWLSFAAQKLFWRYSNLRIILHRRAFLERALKKAPLWLDDDSYLGLDPDTQAEALSAKLCLQTARATIVSINDFFQTRTPNRLEQWYALHFLFHASFVPMIALNSDLGSHQRAVWEEELMLARGTLASLSDDPLAERCLLIIDRLTPPTGAARDLDAIVGLPQSNAWFFPGSESIEQWLPLADLASLNSFWPTAAE